MTAPDADRKPDDVPVPPEALAAGQRTLAAIVFTDTAGFSKLMSKEEERTLRLVARDLDHMKAVCGAFGGQVLKSTGDGLLMLFTSAVQAVACALEIQRDFQKQNLELLLFCFGHSKSIWRTEIESLSSLIATEKKYG